jgi:hypothetical protein
MAIGDGPPATITLVSERETPTVLEQPSAPARTAFDDEIDAILARPEVERTAVDDELDAFNAELNELLEETDR